MCGDSCGHACVCPQYATDPTAHRNRQVPAGGEGLYPLFLNPISGMWTSPKISFGAMGDSFFEYLIKMWVQVSRWALMCTSTRFIDHEFNMFDPLAHHPDSKSCLIDTLQRSQLVLVDSRHCLDLAKNALVRWRLWFFR